MSISKFFLSTALQQGYTQDLTPNFYEVAFGGAVKPKPEDWNKYIRVTNTSVLIGLTDTNGNLKEDYEVSTNYWGGVGTDDVSTGNDSGYVPDLVMKDNLYSFGGGQVTFSNLNANKIYDFIVFATGKGTGDKTQIMKFTGVDVTPEQELNTIVGGVSNTQNAITFTGVKPKITANSVGDVVLDITKKTGTNLVFLQAIIMIEHPALETGLDGTHIRQYSKYEVAGTKYEQDSYVYFPPDYSQRAKFPLLVFLAGQFEIGHGLETFLTQGMPYQIENGVDYSFICASPYNPGNFAGEYFPHWKPEMVKQFTEYCIQNYKVDPDRVYITGLSVGALGVWMTLTQVNNLYAAGLVMAGYSVDPDYPSDNAVNAACSIDSNLPVRVYHGDNDPLVPYIESVNMVNSLNACPTRTGETDFITVDSDVHDIWTAIYSNPLNFQWILNKRKSTN